MNALNPTRKTLLIGMGNSGRADDGLGWKFADEYASANFLDVEYQIGRASCRERVYVLV